jgi:hypothetical protein
LAAGEIRIYSKEGELVHDGYKTRNSGFSGFELKNDHDLKRIGYDNDDDYYWENNNWFDFLFRNGQMVDWDSVLGQVAHGYDQAIEMGINWIKEDKWWNTELNKGDKK